MSIGARKPVLPVAAVCCVLVGWIACSAAPALAAAPETPEISVGSPVQATTATVLGVLNPNAMSEAGSYEFLYKQGNTGCTEGGKAPVPAGVVIGLQGEGVSEVLSGLKPATEYSVCLRVENTTHEEALSPSVSFVTLPEAPVLESVEARGSTTVMLTGELNPNGAKGTLKYQFDYNTDGTCIGGQSTPSVEVSEASQDQILPPVEVQGLEPNEQYTFCLVVTDPNGGQATSGEASAQTGVQAPTIANVSVSNVASTEATISAEIYPHGEATTYHVEYGPTNAYGSSTLDASISAQHGPAGVQARLAGLTPGGEYHYRIVATNKTGSEQSPDETFTTGEASAAGSQSQPDNRSFEMVTPPGNENANVYVPVGINEEGNAGEGIYTPLLFQVATDGSAVAYQGDATSGGGFGEGGLGRGNQFLAKHLAPGGWITNSIQPQGFFHTAYQGFSSDLSVGVLDSGTSAEPENLPLSSEALGEGYNVLYGRVTNKDIYYPLFTKAVQPNRLAKEPESFGNDGDVYQFNQSEAGNPVFAGGSSDFNGLLFEANDALLGGAGHLEVELESDVKTEIAKKETADYLYDAAEGHLSLIDVSPEGEVVPGATVGAPPLNNPKHNAPNFGGAISSDGGRVYWSGLEDNTRPTGIYLRENPIEQQSPVVNGQCTVPSDACTVLVSGGGEAQYWASAADGRYAFYTEDGVLYRFDADSEVGKGQPSRVPMTVPGAGVLGVLGVSKDGGSVYFVATGALASASSAGATPVEGEPNLYLSRVGASPVFIGTLSNGDGSEVRPFSELTSHGSTGEYYYGDWSPGLGQRTARTTGSGNGLVFMSNQSLGVVGHPHGYPTGGADEIYVYNAVSNSLFCASCGSTRGGASGYLPISWDDSYLPQWISEDGNRVFFDSSTSLVPQDTNGKQDVYEWEREGSGTCTTGSGVNGGCVFLLSGGSSEYSSWLIGSSESGDDVFLVTRAQLVPEDQNEAFDLYDARVGGVKLVTPPQCTGTGCQGVPSPPPTFATPPSVTFDGVGNFAAPNVPVVKVKAKSLSRAQKLADALKVCHKKLKSKRASCETRARKQYGPVKKRRKRSGAVVKGRK